MCRKGMLILPDFKEFAKIEPVTGGWSEDRKYCAETPSGERLLIRVSDSGAAGTKKQEFEMLKRFHDAGLPVPEPAVFGISDDGKYAYQILSWAEGREAKEVLPSLTEEEQYSFGREAGQILRRMQEIDRRPPSSDWADMYGARVREHVRAYRACGEVLAGEERYISFLEQHGSCLENRPLCLIHTDFQSDNMVISPEGKLQVIDFQGSGLADPYYALSGVMVSAETSPLFSIGEIHSFFPDGVPEDFWELSVFYTAAENIGAFPVAVRLGREEVEYSNRMSETVLDWYDGLHCFVPSWYREAGMRPADRMLQRQKHGEGGA